MSSITGLGNFDCGRGARESGKARLECRDLRPWTPAACVDTGDAELVSSSGLEEKKMNFNQSEFVVWEILFRYLDPVNEKLL